jgi:hypothetical protein
MNKYIEITKEFTRITKVVFSREYFKVLKHIYGVTNFHGKPSVRVIEYGKFPYITRLEMKRDYLDFIIDSIKGVAHTYGRCLREASCTHPKESVGVDIEGDDDYGFCTQHRCNQCGGYLDRDDVTDRYTGGTNIVREFAKPYYIPKGFYPSKEQQKVWGLEDMEFPLDRGVYYETLESSK